MLTAIVTIWMSAPLSLPPVAKNPEIIGGVVQGTTAPIGLETIPNCIVGYKSCNNWCSDKRNNHFKV